MSMDDICYLRPLLLTFQYDPSKLFAVTSLDRLTGTFAAFVRFFAELETGLAELTDFCKKTQNEVALKKKPPIII